MAEDYDIRYQGDLIAKLNGLSKEQQDELIAELMARTEEEQANEQQA